MEELSARETGKDRSFSSQAIDKSRLLEVSPQNTKRVEWLVGEVGLLWANDIKYLTESGTLNPCALF
jgi:hypothetical protein